MGLIGGLFLQFYFSYLIFSLEDLLKMVKAVMLLDFHLT